MDLSERIRETKIDIFPLDRMLTPTAVYRIFLEEYNKVIDKTTLMTDRKYQRLREGYFTLFVAVTLNKRSGIPIFLVFPKNPDHDVDLIEIVSKKDKGKKWLNDVKEYTDFSADFTTYTEESLKKRIGQYSLIVGVHKDIQSNELKLFFDLLKKEKQIAWLVSSIRHSDKDYNLGKVITLDGRGNYYTDEINLVEELPFDINDPIIIYQDILRDVYE